MVRNLIISTIFIISVIWSFGQGNFFFNQHLSLSVEVDTSTYINIFFDASGSMNSTLAPLEEMRDNYLLDSLISFYDNDTSIYNSHVNVENFTNERTFYIINKYVEQIRQGRRIVNIVFQDESSPYNAETTFPATPSSQYLIDISDLRDSTLTYVETLNYTGVVFQVQYDAWPGFHDLIQAVENGTGNYSGTNGLSDRSGQFSYYYDIEDGGTATYYTNLLMAALRDLGFNL